MNDLLHRLWVLLHSIRFRLVGWFILVIGLVLISFSTFIYLRQVNELRAIAVGRLEYKVERILGLFRVSQRIPFAFNPSLPPNSIELGEPLLQESDVLALFSPQGSLVQTWGPISAEEINQIVKFPSQNIASQNFNDADLDPSTITYQRSNYVYLSTPIVHDHNLLGYILLGNQIDPNNQLPRLLVSLALGVSLTLAFALAGGFWIADRAMRPVKTITRAARSIGETDLNQRLNLGRKDELGELADTFDAMLARLQAAFERQRQFTADASHELRTPLTVIELEISRTLEARRTVQEYEDALRAIHSENQFMIQMVNNLLTLARMDAGQINLQKEVLDLSDITLEVLEHLGPLAVQEQVEFSIGELPALPVCGDQQYLAQMLTNLVENAIKYTSGPDRSVQVETGSKNVGGRATAWVRVIDHGPGIPPEHLPRIFDRYYRVDESRVRRSQDDEPGGEQTPTGTGLGLSIARWVAVAHAGEISVQSEVGRGTTFEVDLPLAVP